MTSTKTFLEIAAAYAPYDRMPAFQLGAQAYMDGPGAVSNCPFSADSVAGQAWDRGAEAAMRYTRQLGGRS